jgi:hypothetical protein
MAVTFFIPERAKDQWRIGASIIEVRRPCFSNEN